MSQSEPQPQPAAIAPVRKHAPLPFEEQPDWIGNGGFMTIHIAAIVGLFLVGWSWPALVLAAVTYLMRGFGLTGGYHRYFAHRTYKTNRVFQFIVAYMGCMAAQKGPLWWAGHHRHHHRFADTEYDVHSPGVRGFFWSHLGWILSRKYDATNLQGIPDFARFPELRFLDRYHVIAPISLALACLGIGFLVQAVWPQSGATPAQMLVWGFFVSTVVLYHATFAVNSLAHMMGTRRFKTRDDSRNNLFISLMTMGEGWHNNHHRYPSSERQGFVWYELDMTHYTLKFLSWFGIVWDLRAPPDEAYEEAAETRREEELAA